MKRLSFMYGEHYPEMKPFLSEETWERPHDLTWVPMDARPHEQRSWLDRVRSA